MAERDRQFVECLSCSQKDELLIAMYRVPTAANFTVTGFNAKNGYSGA